MAKKIDIAQENKEILNKYRALLRACKDKTNAKDKKDIRKAFNLAMDAHQGVRRKSGEPYIYHPLAVAHISAKEIGLGATSIVCALLHDVVEDTEYTLEDIDRKFGRRIYDRYVGKERSRLTLKNKKSGLALKKRMYEDAEQKLNVKKCKEEEIRKMEEQE